MEKSRTPHFDAEERDFLRARVMELEKTVDELREINQDLAIEVDVLKKDVEAYRQLLKRMKEGIRERREDIRSMLTKLYDARQLVKMSVKNCEEMSERVDEEERNVNTVY